MKHSKGLVLMVVFIVVLLWGFNSISPSLAESPLTEKVWEWTPVKYAEVLRQYDISEKDIGTILRVLECESSFVSEQSRIYKNGVREPSFGIAQIHLPSHPDVTKEQALDEEFSINWTAKKWVGGFRNWSCYK